VPSVLHSGLRTRKPADERVLLALIENVILQESTPLEAR
jgi:hypothetical protein